MIHEARLLIFKFFGHHCSFIYEEIRRKQDTAIAKTQTMTDTEKF